MADIRTFPYRRDIRPSMPEGLGEHVDREFQKIETALARFAITLSEIEARIVLLETP